MSILGDAVRGMCAIDLANLLIAAAENPKYKDFRSAAIGFAKEEIYPLYKQWKEDSYGEETELDIKVKQIYES